MKVKDLIKQLAKEDFEKEIYVGCQGYTNINEEDNKTRLVSIRGNLILSDCCHITIEESEE